MSGRGGDFQGTVALVAEYPPPAAGMTVQAQMLRQLLAAEGVRVLPVRTNHPLAGPLRPLRRVRFVRGLIGWLRFLWDCRRLPAAEVVHVFSCSGLGFLLFTATAAGLARLLGPPAVVHFHSGDGDRFLRRHPRLIRWVLSRVERLVVPSGFLRTVFGRHGYQAEVIANPTDLGAFAYAERVRVRPVVLSCRNLFDKYDIPTTLRAFAELARHQPEARLLLAGDGPRRGELEALAGELGIAAAVEFLGNVASDSMPELFRRADILINTPLWDNLPGSVLESFASGVPVVSTNVGGIPWLVEDRVNGLLADSGDWMSLGAHLVRLVEEPELARRLAAAGRRTVAANSWEYVGPRWHALYHQLRRDRAA